MKPTRERRALARLAGGSIEDARPERNDPRAPGAFVDSNGEPGQPFKVIDTLEAMFRFGSIDRPLRSAGERFRDDYQLAGFCGIAAAPLTRIGGNNPESAAFMSDSRVDAATRTALAIQALGGSGPAVEIAVFILGRERSLNEWVAGVEIRKRTASMMLIDVLKALHAHYHPNDSA